MTIRQAADNVKQYAGILLALYEVAKDSADPNKAMSTIIGGVLSSGLVTFPAGFSATADQLAPVAVAVGAVLEGIYPPPAPVPPVPAPPIPGPDPVTPAAQIKQFP